MHQNLISILEASLEPEAAKQAIEAIDPYLKNVSVERSREAQKNSNSSTTSFPRIVPKERRLRGYRNLRQKDHGSRERQILPLILSARSCHDNNGPPSNRSTMSSKSEPIQGSDYNSIEDKKKVDKSLNGNDEQNDASYDKSNVLDILRMERNAAKSKRSEHTSDFSSFWKWKNNGKPVPSSFRSIHNQKLLNKEIKNNKQDIDKMERVNKLKELYSGAVSINVDIRGNTHSVSSNDISTDQKNIQLSPIRHRPSFSKPSTPVVVDKDLTESDMAIVSKYFNKSKPDLHENLPSQNSLSNSPVVAPRSAHKSRNSLHMYSPNHRDHQGGVAIVEVKAPHQNSPLENMITRKIQKMEISTVTMDTLVVMKVCLSGVQILMLMI